MVRWRNEKALVSVSYTLSKATNTTEPDGNGAGPNDYNQLGEEERGAEPARSAPSRGDLRQLSAAAERDGRHRHVAGLGASRSIATTGIDNNGDGANNDRPVIDGSVVSRYAFRGTPIYDASLFAELKLPIVQSRAVTLRVEGFNVFNHANILGRNGTYGNTDTPLPTFGQASGGLSNVDPGRMVQFQVRFDF